MSKPQRFLTVCNGWLLVGASVILITPVSNGQQKTTARISIRPSADSQAKDVNVVNTPGVVVTNPIALAPGASIDIRSSATRLLFQTPAGGVLVSTPQELGEVDVSSFEQIRVVVVNRAFQSLHSAAAIVSLQLVEAGAALGTIDTLLAGEEPDHTATVFNVVSKVYEVPGRTLRITAKAGQDAEGAQGSTHVDVFVFGR